MALINQPPQASNPDATLGNGWSTFFNAVYDLLSALTQSGTTANRPPKMLWVGRTYFDVTLGIPIWYNGAAWINAAGAVV